MRLSSIIIALATVAHAAAAAVPGAKTIARRETCANVTLKMEACVDACDSSDWQCTVNCSLAAVGEYVTCTGN